MKISVILILTVLFFNLNVIGQTRTIIGRVLSEDLESLPMLDIRNSDSVLLGKTDMDGRFKISIPQETESLLLRYLGMEWTDISLKKDCDTIEVVLMYDVIYDFMTSRKIDRLRKNRFDNLPSIHSDAVKNGLFENNNICYDRDFKAYKPDLDRISRELKEFGKTNKNDFKDLSIGDIVKIPFGLDTSEKRISTHYSACKNCTDEDYDYVIKGKIINKHRRKLTLEIKITEMQPYDSLEYGGKILNVGSDFKYEMKYFEVIIAK
ncbi:hypothetical protein [Flavobacterium orientale]|uniref:CarboxypepD_reg-like domain-containing protein n=1 Tax=Flavobacterium orientale TaxID=1756020 RepID=A0A917DBX2_9FLAO|nr:hypothetical protein [Flavobacterium orientale]GGD27043.1 hypothetical protein GCM10011343_16630 [Flavobacterium orientale]